MALRFGNLYIGRLLGKVCVCYLYVLYTTSELERNVSVTRQGQSILTRGFCLRSSPDLYKVDWPLVNEYSINNPILSYDA